MMSAGLVILIILSVLLLFGVLQRVLVRMRMNRWVALGAALAILLCGLIPDIPLGPRASFNIGGALIPLGISVYLFIRAGTWWERLRAVLAALAGAVLLVLADRFFPVEPEHMPFDPYYLYGLGTGLIAWLIGRSRRSSFIGGVCGVLLGDTATAIWAWSQGHNTTLRLGGGGGFDAVVISGILAVVLCELVGESVEKLRGGTSKKNMTVKDGEFVPVKGEDR